MTRTSKKDVLNLVIGNGTLAKAMACMLAKTQPTALCSVQPSDGPFLWRYGDLETGKGLLGAGNGACNLYVFVDETPKQSLYGLSVVLKRLDVCGGVLVHDCNTPVTSFLKNQSRWSLVSLGPCLGATHPLIETWWSAITQGQHLWLLDPCAVPFLPSDYACEAIQAALAHPGSRWSLAGMPVRLPAVAQALAQQASRPLRSSVGPVWWSRRALGLSRAEVQRWRRVKGVRQETAGWQSPSLPPLNQWFSGMS